MTVQITPAFLQNASGTNASTFRQSTSAPFASGGVLSATELAVTAQSTPNMSVVVGPGRAKIVGTAVSPPTGMPFTTQAMYDVLNDAPVTVTVATADATNPRIDVVYAGVQDSFYAGSTNAASVSVVTGTPSASPVVPAIPANAIALANIAVAANATSIVSGNISPQTVLATLQGGFLPVEYVRTSTDSWAATTETLMMGLPFTSVGGKYLVQVEFERLIPGNSAGSYRVDIGGTTLWSVHDDNPSNSLSSRVTSSRLVTIAAGARTINLYATQGVAGTKTVYAGSIIRATWVSF